MNVKWLQKWMMLGSLALAPLALAQGTGAMDEGMQASADAVLTAMPVKTVEEQQIEALAKELDAIRADLATQRARDDQRQMVLGDPDSHPLWP
jgi:hypothetical protein